MFKRLFFLISIVLVLALVGNASAALVGRWTFDDQTANDSSGNEHHGTLALGDATTNITITYDADRDSNVLNCINPAGHTLNSVVDCGNEEGWADITPSITMAVWTRARTLWHGTANYLITKGSAYQFTAVPSGLVRFYVGAHSGEPGGTTTYSTSSLLDDAWHHVVMSYNNDTGSRRVYFDGDLEGEEFPATPLGTISAAFVIGGRLATDFYHRGYDGFLDDVQLYDNALTYAEVRELAENYKAYDPAPADGELDVSLSLGSIYWKPGVRAGGATGNLHKVYFGTDKGLVQSGNISVYKTQADSNSYSGAPMGSLSAGVDYYWKVNAVNGVDEWPGDVWTFRTLSLKASEPVPVDTSKYVGTTRTRVSWRAGDGATSHAVYYGTDETLVTNGDASVYKGTFPVIISDYNDPNWPISPALVADVKYYWRIDVNAPVVYQGNIWSFTASTPEADPNFVAWWKFDEKSGDLVWDATGREHHGTMTQRAAETSIDIVYDADVDSNVLDINNPPGHGLGSVVDAGGNMYDSYDPCWADIQTAITVAGWTKLDEMHITNYMLTKGARYQLTAVADDPDTGAGDGRIRAYTNEYVFDDYVTYSVSEVNDGKWHHIAFTYDSGTKQRIVYIDGDREAAETLTPDTGDNVFPLLDVTTSVLVIGGRLDPAFTYRCWNGLVKDVRIYDRALSRNELHLLGVTDVNKAWGPYPQTATDPVSDWPLQLYWIPGDNVQGTQGHKVYLGTDQSLVEANDVSVLLGTYDSNTAAAPMASMRFGGTYYWKVNELNGATEWPGKVWWFRMGDYKPWEDFESYDFGMNLIGSTWKIPDWTGGVINLGQSSDNEPVNGGIQSMKYEYDNQGGSWYFYSEAYRDFSSSQDWSYATGGVKSLRLYFYGETGNYPDDMYVVLDDGSNESMKLYDRDLSDLKAGEWKHWDIDLSWFTDGANNVNLASVDRVCIGFGERGREGFVVTRLAGTVYFDDFRAYPPHCVSDRLKPGGDVTGNCIVNNVDIRWMSYRWGDNDYTITPSNPGDSNLVGCWNFDDGTADDSSGKGHHGTLVQGHTATSVKIVDDADRGSKVLELNNPDILLNSVVDCDGGPYDADPNWAVIKEQISIAAWLKVDTFFQSDQYMLARGAAYQVRRYTTTDDMGCYMGELSDSTLRSDSAYSSSDIDDGKWHHVAFTYDSDANERKVYIDGRLAGTDTPSGELETIYHDVGFVIGGRLDGTFNTRGWDGRIDEVRLYDDVLTHEEVVYIMTGSTSPQYFPVWSLGNLTDAGDPVNSRFVNLKDYNLIANTWLTEQLWPSGW